MNIFCQVVGLQWVEFILFHSLIDTVCTSFQRAAWIPYFRDMTALIFLAPLSGFNERLPEDDSINRLEDSFSLWKTICSSKLLANIQLVRFQARLRSARSRVPQSGPFHEQDRHTTEEDRAR